MTKFKAGEATKQSDTNKRYIVMSVVYSPNITMIDSIMQAGLGTTVKIELDQEVKDTKDIVGYGT